MIKVDSAITTLESEFVHAWQLCTGSFPRAESFDRVDLSCRWAGIPFRFYNALCLRGTFNQDERLRSSVEDAISFMRKRTEPGWLIVTQDQLGPSARAAFDEIVDKEQIICMPATGMAGDILPLRTSEPSGLKFKRILDPATVTDFIDLNSKAYHLPPEPGRSVIGDLAFWRDHAFGYVAYEGGRPVSTATGIVVDTCIFLFLVATDPERQRRGYANAVIRHALNHAHLATGITRTSLQATDAGRPVYATLGYKEICRYQLVWPADDTLGKAASGGKSIAMAVDVKDEELG